MLAHVKDYYHKSITPEKARYTHLLSVTTNKACHILVFYLDVDGVLRASD